MDCATAFLKLSEESSLFLFVSGSFPLVSRRSRPTSAIARDLFQSISVNVPRLFACNVFAPPPELRRIWTCPAPNLRHLSIQCDGQDLGRSMIFEDAPHLETLRLADCEVPSLICPQNLTVLVLENRNSLRKFSLRRFLRTLEGVPRISHLVLRRFYDISVTMPPPQCVVLAQLRTLELELCDTHLILSHLDVAPAASTTISHDRFSPTDSIISCLPKITGRSSFLSGSKYIDITLFAAHEEYTLCIVARSGSRVLLRARVLQFMRDETWLFQSLEAIHLFPPFTSASSICLHTDAQHIPWSTVLSRLPSLSHLDVRCTDWISLFNALMIRSPDGSQWTHPRIRTLFLEMDSACNANHTHLKACVDYLIHLKPPLERIGLTVEIWEYLRREDPSWDGLVHSLGMPPFSHEKKPGSKRHTVTIGRKIIIQLKIGNIATME